MCSYAVKWAYAHNFFFFFWPCHLACGILVPQSGIKLEFLAVKAQSPKHWATREFLACNIFGGIYQVSNINNYNAHIHYEIKSWKQFFAMFPEDRQKE